VIEKNGITKLNLSRTLKVRRRTKNKFVYASIRERGKKARVNQLRSAYQSQEAGSKKKAGKAPANSKTTSIKKIYDIGRFNQVKQKCRWTSLL